MAAYIVSNPKTPLRQCEILAGVIEARIAIESLRQGDGDEIEERLHPFAVVINQECDLVWDYNARSASPGNHRLASKLLPNILFCELWPADRLRGNQSIASDIWRRIKQNQDERYHYLQGCKADCDLGGEGLPELAIDFKRVFTVPTEEVYHRIGAGQVRRRCVLGWPFLQDLSNRFGYYHLRVALPDPVPVAGVAQLSTAGDQSAEGPSESALTVALQPPPGPPEPTPAPEGQ